LGCLGPLGIAPIQGTGIGYRDVLTGIRLYIRVKESGPNWYQVRYGDSILGKTSLLAGLTCPKRILRVQLIWTFGKVRTEGSPDNGR